MRKPVYVKGWAGTACLAKAICQLPERGPLLEAVELPPPPHAVIAVIVPSSKPTSNRFTTLSLKLPSVINDEDYSCQHDGQINAKLTLRELKTPY